MKSTFAPLVFLLSMLFVTACNEHSQDQIDPAEDVILQREVMIKLMAEMEITEAALRMKQVRLQRDSIKVLVAEAMDSIFIHYQTTPEGFKTNLKYYQSDLENYQKMLDEVIEMLSKMKDSVVNLKNEQLKIVQDSLRQDSLKQDSLKKIKQ